MKARMILPVAVVSSGRRLAGLVDEDLVVAEAGADEQRGADALLRALQLLVLDEAQRQAGGVQREHERARAEQEATVALHQVARRQQPVGELLDRGLRRLQARRELGERDAAGGARGHLHDRDGAVDRSVMARRHQRDEGSGSLGASVFSNTIR
jgi:hypothetical protein